MVHSKNRITLEYCVLSSNPLSLIEVCKPTRILPRFEDNIKSDLQKKV